VKEGARLGYSVDRSPGLVTIDAAAVRVRRAEAADWASYRDIRLKALESEPWAFGSTLLREREYPESRWRELVSRDSADSPAATWAAVDEADRFVGVVVAARVEGTFHIFAMWVARERRGQGIAGRLLDAALAWVERVAPGSPVVLEVNPRAVAAVRLYLSRGFRATGKFTTLDHTPSERVDEMIRPG
jgi:ribosomal protein S18 acetylase RimI-like enzyme